MRTIVTDLVLRISSFYPALGAALQAVVLQIPRLPCVLSASSTTTWELRLVVLLVAVRELYLVCLVQLNRLPQPQPVVRAAFHARIDDLPLNRVCESKASQSCPLNLQPSSLRASSCLITLVESMTQSALHTSSSTLLLKLWL